MDKVRHLFSLLLVFLLLATVAVNRDNRLLGYDVDKLLVKQEQKVGSREVLRDNTDVFSSEDIAKDIVGYAGPTPVNVFIKDGRVVGINALENNETPSFFKRVTESGLLEAWNGMSVDKAVKYRPDAVSGATYSSNAIIENVQLTLAHACNVIPSTTYKKFGWSVKSIMAILVLISGIIISVFFKSRPMRIVQLVLNVVVLGLWCGNFLSMSLIINWISNGVHLSVALVPFLLLVIAIVLPFLGRKSHYCNWACPMGSLQELLGSLNKNKLSIPERLMKVLSHIREAILLILLTLMWVGVGFELMDYEIFSVFIFKQASWFVISLASVFLVLSCFINRPYCRFICPTGQLLAWSQKSNK